PHGPAGLHAAGQSTRSSSVVSACHSPNSISTELPRTPVSARASRAESVRLAARSVTVWACSETWLDMSGLPWTCFSGRRASIRSTREYRRGRDTLHGSARFLLVGQAGKPDLRCFCSLRRPRRLPQMHRAVAPAGGDPRAVAG